MSGKGVWWTAYRIFADVGDMRTEMRGSGHNQPEIDAATERMVRHHLEPEVPPLVEWPAWLDVPRCAYCDGTGLILRRVVNRLGYLVDQGTPCKCAKGARFLSKQTASQDYTDAGKMPKKAPSRFGR